MGLQRAPQQNREFGLSKKIDEAMSKTMTSSQAEP
jgi:hypothetical protein